MLKIIQSNHSPAPMHIDDPALCHIAAEREGTPIGSLCAFVNPQLPPTLGLIGWYDCADDSEASASLLEAAVEILRARGCTSVTGPVNGDTWHRYRVALPSDSPPFFLDVENPSWYAGQWRSAGFSPVAEYFSTEIPIASVDMARIERDEASYRQQGVTIRPVDPQDFDSELALIHTMALKSFDRNFLYTPISLDEFLEIYRPVLPVVVRELVELAFDAEGAPVAFCFALPDLLAPPGSRVIAKTAGKVGREDLRGLGTHMIERVQLTAGRMGYRSVVHALMHRQNRSGRILEELARPLKSYELYGRTI